MKKNLARFPKTALVSILLAILSSRLFSQAREHPPISPETYLQRLQTVAAETLKSEFESEFMLLLDGREKQYYEALAPVERRSYIARYWRLRDPDPFTSNNERLEEHLARRDFSREHFKTDRPPYFDDRGKIYLKYGRPRDRYVDPGIYMQVNRELSIFLQDEEFARPSTQSALTDTGVFALGFQGRTLVTKNTPETLLPPGKIMVLENETWSYEHVQAGLVFNFVRQGKHFHLVTDLRQAVTGGRMRYRTLQAAVMYLRRQNLSRSYVDLAREFENVGQRLRMQPGGLQLTMLDNEIRVALERNTFDVEEIIRKSPPEAFIRKPGEKELPFSADIAQFRGEANRTRVVIGIAANFGRSETAMDSAGHAVTALRYSCVLNDRSGERIASAEQGKNVLSTATGTASILGAVSMIELDCVSEQYLLALQAAEANGSRKSMLKLPLFVRDFRGPGLMLSDLQFCVPLAASTAELAKESGAPKTVLYPFATVLKSIPLAIYFEIYNLSTIGFNKEYRIDYHVTEAPAGRNLLSALAKPFRKNDDASITLSERRSVTQPASRELLTLDFSKLRPGAYQLEVIVSALHDSSLVAAAAKNFVLFEEKTK